MARALDQIISELNNVYNPQRDVYNSQLQTLDPQMQAEEKGLEAAKQDAFGQIDQTANRRGLFYSGIPIAEQQRYTGASFLPAVANLRGRYAQQRFNLQDALAKITQEQYMKGQSIYQTELDRDAQLAAARSSGGGGGAPDFSWLTNVLGAQYRNWPTQQQASLDELANLASNFGQPVPQVKAANVGKPMYQINGQWYDGAGDKVAPPKTNTSANSPATGTGLSLTKALGSSLYK